MDNATKIQDTTANPAPLGLMGFGMTTILLNLHNAGFFGLDSAILAMGLFYGGITQLIVGIMEWKKGNTFGTVAFTSYGAFWITLVGLMVMPKLGWTEAPSPASWASFLFVWGFFSLLLFIGTLRLNKALQFVFGTLVILFFLLAAGKATGNAGIMKIAGYEGIICGASAMYAAIAQVYNEMHGKVVLPLGPVKAA
ncbi:MAG: acetate uptake transporter [Candidatus Edwardsbacteria bacterium]|nr:acetate uptake transporter [Candidatus Edwardsbacteria bacterium]